MDEVMIARWNDTIRPEDFVYVLGNIALSEPVIGKIIPRLNGRKILVHGNHDKCHPMHKDHKDHIKFYLDAGFESIETEVWLYGFGGEEIVRLHHFPYKPAGRPAQSQKHERHRLRNDGLWLLHGHVHTAWKRLGRMINVGADVWDYRPVALDTLIKVATEPDTQSATEDPNELPGM